ncbi:MAG: serine hydrolase [Actinobacteria bacterium]|nr:serine hydrolase [Actinomycetota bacterium]
MPIDTAAVERVADELFAADAAHGVSLALVVMQSGVIVGERYGQQPDTMFGPGGPVDEQTTLISWSMAKSITHAAVGLLVGDGRLHLEAPAPVAEWVGTPKAAITLQQLLNMRSGLEFVEDYVDDSVSHCLEMLYGAGADDMAAYAAGLPLLHPPGSTWNYSSGTSNIVARIVGEIIGGGRPGVTAFLRERLFEPAGMSSAIPKFDNAGTFVGSSYVYATARDFARFGEMYRNDGVAADGSRVLPVGWRDHARTFTAHDTAADGTAGFDYGAHWWLWPEFAGSLACHGYEGQYTVVLPDRELVVVHLGKTPAAQEQLLTDRLREMFRAAS